VQIVSAVNLNSTIERAHFEKSKRLAASRRPVGGSYPVLLNRKKRAALITYRHSEYEHFENAFVP
jgi:hypothetical protein